MLGATIGYLSGVARAYAWDPGVLGELAGLGAVVGEVASRDPSAPAVHLELAALFGATRRLVASLESEWAKVDAADLSGDAMGGSHGSPRACQLVSFRVRRARDGERASSVGG